MVAASFASMQSLNYNRLCKRAVLMFLVVFCCYVVLKYFLNNLGGVSPLSINCFSNYFNDVSSLSIFLLFLRRSAAKLFFYFLIIEKTTIGN